MLTYEDCIGLSDLTADEVDAIAEHEHVPSIVALELGRSMLDKADGPSTLQRFIQEDIEHARERGDSMHAADLKLTLQSFQRRCGTLAA